MAVTINEDKYFRVQNQGFGRALKLTLAAEAGPFTLNDMPQEKSELSIVTSTGVNIPFAESGPALILSPAAAITGTVYVKAVGAQF